MSAGAEPPEAPRQTVLVIDSEILVRHALAQYLRGCGYDVVEAADTDEAQTLLTDGSLSIDAALCDAGARGSVNVFALAREFRAARPGLTFLLAGALERKADAAADLCDEGPELARPYDPQGVVAEIRQRMAQRERSAGAG